jgi:Toprim-like
MIDWVRILDQYGVEWQHGSGNNIEISCPYCGSSDEGKHLSISLNNKGYRCWRRPDQHFGKNLPKLLVAVLKISIQEAQAISGIRYSYVEGDGSISFANNVAKLLDNGSGSNATAMGTVAAFKTLEFPSGFRPISKFGGIRSVHAYIQYRGYPDAEADLLIKRYNLQTTLDGPFSYRVVIPIYMPYMGLVNWTARTTTESPYLRYRTLTTDPERSKQQGMPPAALQINKTLLNYDQLSEDYGRDLVICEGPFDALKVDHYGREAGVRATCTFGKNISDQQINLLTKIKDRYKNIWLALDEDAELEALSVLGRLQHLQPRMLRLPRGVGDPGNLSKQQVRSWI